MNETLKICHDNTEFHRFARVIVIAKPRVVSSVVNCNKTVSYFTRCFPCYEVHVTTNQRFNSHIQCYKFSIYSIYNFLMNY